MVFSSINYGTDTSAEGRCVIREILKSTYEGVGNGETAIFPIQIWKKKRGISYLPTDRNYDLYQYACKVTARRFFPNFINLDAPFTTQEIFQGGDALYYGLNATSGNMILADRKQNKTPNGLILGTPGSGKSFSAKRSILNVFLITRDDIIICDKLILLLFLIAT